jgi:hypothetical protein
VPRLALPDAVRILADRAGSPAGATIWALTTPTGIESVADRLPSLSLSKVGDVPYGVGRASPGGARIRSR